MGVALSIRGRLRDLGGTAELISVPGQGTEVELRVPNRRPRTGGRADRADGRRTGGGDGDDRRRGRQAERQRPIKVMVVDDHPMWRDAVARDLAEAGLRRGRHGGRRRRRRCAAPTPPRPTCSSST